MTMVDNTCDVCGRGGAIGVASTIMPYSCAYCRECLEHFAQPECVFSVIDFYDDDEMADHIVTYKNGRYITYREWRSTTQENENDKTDRSFGST